MGFWGPLEQAKLLLVRPDVTEALSLTRDEFERQTGERVYVISGWRSDGEQEATEAEGAADGFRAASAETSRHPLGAAGDLGIMGHVTDALSDQKDPLYKTLADIAQRHGLKAGYYFKSHPEKPDPYHLEADEPLAISQAKWAALIKERRSRLIVFLAVTVVVAIAVSLHKKKGKR